MSQRSSHYPDGIQECITEISSWVAGHLPVDRLLLLGSTARGELTWTEQGGRSEVLSDVEFYLLTKRRLSASERAELKRARASWAQRWSYPNPYFHLDFSINPSWLFWPKLKLDRRIARYELVENAKVLVGSEFDRARYRLGIEQLDRGALNELLLTRLWMQLLFVPADIAEEHCSERCRLLFTYGVCRNLLEILTILLPQYGHLAPTYTRRFEIFDASRELQSLLPARARDDQEAALRAKLEGRTEGSVQEWYGRLLMNYRWLLGRLLEGNTELAGAEPEDDLSPLLRALSDKGAQLLRDGTLTKARRGRRQARMAIRLARRRGPAAAIRWTATDHRPAILACLLLLHHALHDILERRSPARHLTRAVDYLRTFHFGCDIGHDVAQQEPMVAWQHVRNSLIEFMSIWKYNNPQYLASWGILTWRTDAAQ